MTRKLGLRFLWVDALCILQDSRDDKAREIAQIRHIFRDSYVTIIAACAHKISDGFLHDRRTTITEWCNWETKLLPFLCPNGSIGTMQLHMKENIPTEPINDRAWCLEERALSARRLVYATHTLLYECQTIHDNVNHALNFVEMTCAEDIPRLPDCIFLPAPATPRGNHPESAEDEASKSWSEMLDIYTQRALTKPRDRLIALSGIAEQFSRFWSHSKYIAGLWEHQLPGSLLWHNRGLKECCSRPDRYRAPSWSWASTDGRIDVGYCSNEGTTFQWDVTATHPVNPFGQVNEGSLVLDAILQPAVWHPVVEGLLQGYLLEADGVLTDPPKSPKLEWDRYERGQIGFAMRDAIEPVSEEIGRVHLALVRLSGDLILYGLVLVPATSEIANAERNDYPVFRRVGWFNAPYHRSPNLETWLKSMPQRIKIV